MSTNDALPKTLPPGQRRLREHVLNHYGRVPARSADVWRLTVDGATQDGAVHSLRLADVHALPRTTVDADLHCVGGWSVTDLEWEGASTRDLLDLVPPADEVTHVLAVAEYGYSATVRLDDLASPRSMLAWRLGGAALTAEHGWPLRLVVPHLFGYKNVKWLRGLHYHSDAQRGFWESRGYHVGGDVWRGERYSYQE